MEIIANSYSARALCNVGCLGSFRSLDNFKLYRISFLQSPIAVTSNGRIMHKYIWPVIAPDEAIPLGIIEPLDRSLHVKRDLQPGGRKKFVPATHGEKPHDAEKIKRAECSRMKQRVNRTYRCVRSEICTAFKEVKRFHKLSAGDPRL